MRATRDAIVVLGFIAIVASDRVHAQQSVGAPALMVGVTGTADVGGRFDGTFLVTRFDSSASGIVAVGSVNGVLNGRSIATKVAIPVTVAASSAQAPAVAPAVCGIRVGLEPSVFRASGAAVTLARSGVEITAPPADASSAVADASPVTIGMIPPGPIAAFPTASSSTTQPGTLVPTAPVGSAIPGVISPAPRVNSPVATSFEQFGQRLCSLSGLPQTSAQPAQVVQALNQMLLALQQ